MCVYRFKAGRRTITIGDCVVNWSQCDVGPGWRDALETVINSRKLSDALGNPSTQRKCYYSPIWQITQYITDKNNTTHF